MLSLRPHNTTANENTVAMSIFYLHSLTKMEINWLRLDYNLPAILLDRRILKMAGMLEESQHILDNNPAAGLARAIAKVWELYGSEK